MATIIPAILPTSFVDLDEKVLRISRLVSSVQVDIVDGVFAPGKTWPFVNDHGDFKKLLSEVEGLPAWENISYEIDMMVADPLKIFDDWVSVGASTIIIHRESVDDATLDALITRGNEKDISLGIALKPSTPLSMIESYLDRVPRIQCMGNDQIGRQGTPLDPSVFEKIKAIRDMAGAVTISVDIGVNRDTAPKLISAGATILVSGSAIFESDSPGDAIAFFSSL